MQHTNTDRQHHQPLPRPDELLAMHNQFVERRGYHEYTDDEVQAINFKKSPSATLASETHANAKDDNKLLALIREINQITTASENAKTSSSTAATETAMRTANDAVAATNASVAADTIKSTAASSIPTIVSGDAKQCTVSGGHDKMFSENNLPSDFNKRYSSYERFVPLGEHQDAAFAMPNAQSKRYSNIETTRFESRKRVENGNVVYDVSDRSTEKNSCMEGGGGGESTAQKPQAKCNANATNLRNDFFIGMNQPVFDRPAASSCVFEQQQRSEGCDDVATANNKNSRVTHETKVTNSESKMSSEYTSEMMTTKSTTATNEPGVAATAATDKQEWLARNPFSLRDFDYIPKSFTDLFAKQSTTADAKAASNNVRNDKMPATAPIPTVSVLCDEEPSRLTNQEVNRMQTHRELYSSTQSLRDWLENVKIPQTQSRSTTPGVQQQPPRPLSRISPCPIRAPRVTDSPGRDTVDEAQRRYDLYTTRNARRYDNRQSMIDQTPITRHVRDDRRRQSLPRALHDKQLNYILEKEEQLSAEYDHLERQRRRLLEEIEEIKVNQDFEDCVRQHKMRVQGVPRSMNDA